MRPRDRPSPRDLVRRVHLDRRQWNIYRAAAARRHCSGRLEFARLHSDSGPIGERWSRDICPPTQEQMPAERIVVHTVLTVLAGSRYGAADILLRPNGRHRWRETQPDPARLGIPQRAGRLLQLGTVHALSSRLRRRLHCIVFRRRGLQRRTAERSGVDTGRR